MRASVLRGGIVVAALPPDAQELPA
jgi:hypothetical protein